LRKDKELMIEFSLWLLAFSFWLDLASMSKFFSLAKTLFSRCKKKETPFLFESQAKS